MCVLGQPAPQHSLCRNAQSGTGSLTCSSLSGADWRLIMKGGDGVTHDYLIKMENIWKKYTKSTWNLNSIRFIYVAGYDFASFI